MKEITIGMFGTCGKSTFRKELFIPEYDKYGIPYFNPQVDNWDESMAITEAEHLAEDGIVLFPITGETYGTGSLAETGFSILQAISLEKNRSFIIMIEMNLNENLKKNEELYKDSLRSRALVLQHLKKLNLANVYLVPSLEEMLRVSIILQNSAKIKDSVKNFSLVK